MPLFLRTASSARITLMAVLAVMSLTVACATVAPPAALDEQPAVTELAFQPVPLQSSDDSAVPETSPAGQVPAEEPRNEEPAPVAETALRETPVGRAAEDALAASSVPEEERESEPEPRRVQVAPRTEEEIAAAEALVLAAITPPQPIAAAPAPAGALLETGVASTYGTGDGFQGNTTACGQVFDTYVPQVAHKTLPCGTMVRVEDANTGKSVTVEVTDRGPYIPGRVVDLSWAAYRQLDPVGPGLLDVRVFILP